VPNEKYFLVPNIFSSTGGRSSPLRLIVSMRQVQKGAKLLVLERHKFHLRAHNEKESIQWKYIEEWNHPIYPKFRFE